MLSLNQQVIEGLTNLPKWPVSQSISQYLLYMKHQQPKGTDLLGSKATETTVETSQ